jgi:hypothetical protein
VDPLRVQSALVRLAGLKRSPGSQSLRLEGTLTLPQPFVPPDPVVQGVSLTVRDAAAEKLLDVRVPGGAFDAGTGVGWKPLLFATGFRYVNPDGLMGITAVVVRWNAAGQVTVQVSGSGASLTPSGHPLPLLWQLNLDPDRVVTDRCGETDYGAASCTFRRRGAVLACR